MPRAKQATVANSKTTSQPLRRSTRTVTVPELFMRRKETIAAARRRGETTEESNSQDELDSDSEGESDNESRSSDSEAETSSSKRRKTKSSYTSTPRTSTRRTRKSAQAVTEVSLTHSSQLLEHVSADSEETLYEKVSAANEDMDTLAANWITQYRSNDMDALRDLVNFIIKSCGCLTAVTREAFAKEDIAIEVLQELQEELRELPQPEYPVISKSKDGKLLKRNIIHFIQSIVDGCQHDIMFDGTFVEMLQNWLTTMASSVYRPFRHTATIMALKIMSSLCVIAEKTNDEEAIATRQLATEQKKPARSRNAEKQRLLKQRLQALERKKTDLREYMDDFFESVFVHRSRDVEYVIRAECIKELCAWMELHPAHYVDNQYLRYFGWALNDQHSAVRSDSLKAITALTKKEEVVDKLETFLGRFKSRIEEMALYDIDYSVRVHAIELCCVLCQRNSKFLSAEARQGVLDLAFAENARMRKAAAPLIKLVLNADIVKPKLEEVRQALSRSDHGSTAVTESWVTYKCIAAFLVDRQSRTDQDAENMDPQSAEPYSYQDDRMVYQTIDTLWAHLAHLQDYQAMADYLGHDHSTAQQSGAADIPACYRLTDAEETVLINVFTICLKLVVERGFDRAGANAKEKKKTNDEQQREENRNALSRYLVQILPGLLAKHRDSVTKMIKLVGVPQLMNINIYLELRMQKEYEEMLSALSKLYQGATLSDMVECCALSLQHMQNASQLAEINDRMLGELAELICTQVRDACRGKDLTTGILSADDIHNLSTSVGRLSSLIHFRDVTDVMDESEDMEDNVTQLVGLLVDRASFGNKNEQQTSIASMEVLFRYFAWKCESIANDPDLLGPGRAALAEITRRQDWVLNKFTELATSTELTPLAEVKSLAVGILLDLHWLLSSDILSTKDGYTAPQIPANVQSRCVDYMVSEIERCRQILQEKDENGEDDTADTTTVQENYISLTATFARALKNNVIDVKLGSVLLSQYDQLHHFSNDIVKSLIEELNMDMIGDEERANNICQMYLDSLIKSFESQVTSSFRSIDKTLALGRLQSNTIHSTDQEDPARHVPPQALCERLHFDGITYILKTVARQKENNDNAGAELTLRFFRVLTVLVRPLSRARDVARIHKHIEESMEKYKVHAEEGSKGWEAYQAYIKAIDSILKKKGLRYAK